MLRLKMAYTVALVSLMSIPNAGTAEPVAPNEVCVYEHIKYVNKLGCFSLKPGMRQVLVPNLSKLYHRRTSSIQIGKNVEVMCFEFLNFQERIWHHGWAGEPDLKFNSMIVAPRKQGSSSIKGVSLWSGAKLFGMHGGSDRFLPLPELLKDAEARYQLTGSWNDAADSVKLWGDVEVVLFRDHDYKGKHVTLPGSGYYDDPSRPHESKPWKLEQFGLFDEVSSVIVRDIHALKAIQTPIKKLLPPPERVGQGPAQVHRAPPAQEQLPELPPYPGQTGAIAPVPTMKPSVPLASLITGNTLKVRVGTQGVSWSIYFRPDNAVFARSNQGKEDSGKWWISGEVYCTQYQHLNNSKRSCYSLARVGDQLRVHKAADGQQVGIADILEGNPENLGYPSR